MDWPVFENEFYGSTNEMKLSNRDNLRRLNKAIQGKARKAIESLLTSEQNVDKIMRLLKTNFGRAEWIVNNRLDALRSLQPIKSGDIEALRTFYNTVSSITTLKNINASGYLMNPELVSNLADKLPYFSKQMWVREKATLIRAGEVADVDAFAAWLEDEMDNPLAGLNPNANPVHNKKPTSSARKLPLLNINGDEESDLETTEDSEEDIVPKVKNPMLNINEDRQKKSPPKPCQVCKSTDHNIPWKCKRFKDMPTDQRRKLAKDLNLCYVCLSTDHSRRRCKSKRKCYICKNNHHELLHPKEEETASSEKGKDEVCNVNLRGGNTLLRVAKVRLFHASGVKITYALFDEGSSLSMIETSLAEELQLTGPTKSYSYKWTNDITHTEDGYMMLNVLLSGPSESAKQYLVHAVRTNQNMNLPRVQFDLESVKADD